MKYDDFVKAVQTRGRLSSMGGAVEAIHATLETLGRCLTQEEADHLATELPHEIGVYLQDVGNAETLSLDEFFKHVNEKQRETVGLAETVQHTHSVISVLQDAVSKGEISDIQNQLPEDFEPLFRAGIEDYMTRKGYKAYNL